MALGWFNLIHRKARTGSALAGVTMAILLVFLQLGFFKAAFVSSIMVTSQMAYDIALVSPQYLVLRQAGYIERHRLYQAASVAGVQRVVPLYTRVALALNAQEGLKRELLVIGVDPINSPFADAAINQLVNGLSAEDSAIVDRKTGPGYAELPLGSNVEVNGRRLEIIGEYSHGAGFAGNAALIVSDLSFASIFDDASVHKVTIGLVALTPGADVVAVRDALQEVLAKDTRVLTRAQQESAEQDFSLNVKPVGIMFSAGLALAFLVGAVILYQVLSAEIANHLREYATLKAIGYSTLHVHKIVWQQAILFAVLGFVPATLLATIVYAVIDATTTLPTRMSLDSILVVFAASVLMCTIAGALAVRKVNRADPADLF